MILADKIIALRKKNGWSQEELAEKLNVSRQSVSKWEGGLSVPDMNKIIGMSALFGVSTDYLLKDDLESITPSETAESDDRGTVRAITAEAANRYIDTVKKLSLRVALAVALCILSPVCLLLLGGFSEVAGLLSESLAAAIGLVALFLFIGVAVSIFIPTGMQLSEFSYLEKECFSLDYGVKGIVEKRQKDFAPRYRFRLTLGTLLCIFSIIPLLAFGALDFKEEILIVCLVLIFVISSVGVALIVRACYIGGSFARLLQMGDFSEESKKRSHEGEAFEAAYWGLFTAIYLGVSFWTSRWGITWVIWPVAGCLFPMLQYLLGGTKKK